MPPCKVPLVGNHCLDWACCFKSAWILRFLCLPVTILNQKCSTCLYLLLFCQHFNNCWNISMYFLCIIPHTDAQTLLVHMMSTEEWTKKEINNINKTNQKVGYSSTLQGKYFHRILKKSTPLQCLLNLAFDPAPENMRLIKSALLNNTVSKFHKVFLNLPH